MTKVYCKSDCYFSQNEERACRLTEIQLIQENKFSPKLVCYQYVPTQVSQQNQNQNDINKAMDLGLESAINEKVGK